MDKQDEERSAGKKEEQKSSNREADGGMGVPERKSTYTSSAWDGNNSAGGGDREQFGW